MYLLHRFYQQRIVKLLGVDRNEVNDKKTSSYLVNVRKATASRITGDTTS
jgi:hypothetical protein